MFENQDLFAPLKFKIEPPKWRFGSDGFFREVIFRFQSFTWNAQLDHSTVTPGWSTCWDSQGISCIFFWHKALGHFFQVRKTYRQKCSYIFIYVIKQMQCHFSFSNILTAVLEQQRMGDALTKVFQHSFEVPFIQLEPIIQLGFAGKKRSNPQNVPKNDAGLKDFFCASLIARSLRHYRLMVMSCVRCNSCGSRKRCSECDL